MTQQAVGTAETPLISPTDDLDSLWKDVAYEGDDPDGSSGEQSPEPEADDDGLDDDGGESGDDDADEQPVEQGPQAAAQRREDWVRSVAMDPSAIQQVPRRQRKAILAAAEVVKPAAVNIARGLAPQLADQRYWQMIELHDKVEELSVLAEEDPQQFQAALANPTKHGFSEEAVDQWRKVQYWRENGGPGGGTPPAAPQQTQQQGQPQVDPGVQRWATRATAILDEFGEEFGQDAAGEVVSWLQEEGLLGVRTAQEAESGYKALKRHLDEQRAKRAGGPPPAVQRRRSLPKPDVSPGSVAVGGRASREDIHRRTFGGSESDAWASLED